MARSIGRSVLAQTRCVCLLRSSECWYYCVDQLYGGRGHEVMDGQDNEFEEMLTVIESVLYSSPLIIRLKELLA